MHSRPAFFPGATCIVLLTIPFPQAKKLRMRGDGTVPSISMTGPTLFGDDGGQLLDFIGFAETSNIISFIILIIAQCMQPSFCVLDFLGMTSASFGWERRKWWNSLWPTRV